MFLKNLCTASLILFLFLVFGCVGPTQDKPVVQDKPFVFSDADAENLITVAHDFLNENLGEKCVSEYFIAPSKEEVKNSAEIYPVIVSVDFGIINTAMPNGYISVSSSYTHQNKVGYNYDLYSVGDGDGEYYLNMDLVDYALSRYKKKCDFYEIDKKKATELLENLTNSKLEGGIFFAPVGAFAYRAPTQFSDPVWIGRYNCVSPPFMSAGSGGCDFFAISAKTAEPLCKWQTDGRKCE